VEGIRAVILAAGRGVRMGGETPKTLIPVHDDKPLLHYILTGLEAAGIGDVLVVTGFKPAPVQEFTAAFPGELQFSFVRNTRYASWGNFHSLRMAIDQSPGSDLLVINSDVVVGSSVYREVASSEGDLVLAVQRSRQLDEEDMRVELRGHEVRAIGKHLKKARSHAEFAGVSLLRPDAARRYADIATGWEWRGTTTGYYEDIYAEVLGDVDARAVFLKAGEYAEVDTPEDMDAAARVIEGWSDSLPEPTAVPARGAAE
jgi:choline kinase